jgi:hypothetical protein
MTNEYSCNYVQYPNFIDAISKTIPQEIIQSGSTIPPCVIAHIGNTWRVYHPQSDEMAQSVLAEMRKEDPCAVAFANNAFARLGWCKILDKALVARLEQEYRNAKIAGEDTEELYELLCFCKDNAVELSLSVVDWLTTCSCSLKWLLNELAALIGTAFDKTPSDCLAAISECCDREIMKLYNL